MTYGGKTSYFGVASPDPAIGDVEKKYCQFILK